MSALGTFAVATEYGMFTRITRWSYVYAWNRIASASYIESNASTTMILKLAEMAVVLKTDPVLHQSRDW